METNLDRIKETLKSKELFIFDMDGTVYLGTDPFPFAIRFIRNLRRDGKQVLFYTNNASLNRESYLRKLTGMGFEPTEKEILTSGDVAVSYLCRCHKGKRVFLLGTEDLKADCRKAGIELAEAPVPETDPITAQPPRFEADLVLVSLDFTLTYDKLYYAANLIRSGVPFFTTHHDAVYLSNHGWIPDAGAICDLLATATGVQPVCLGKPLPYAIDTISERFGTKKDKMVMFGDRLDTDIFFGSRNGFASVLVETGVSTLSQAQALPASDQPYCAFRSLEEVDRILYGGDANGI
ncbi:MAG: HAD-IIA family hydrolase [Clostridia bacterium]|nr:HAD-IIA family hydrolase [Clostridia bacterium]